MPGVLVAFSADLLAGLADRPGNGKFEKEAAARRRSALLTTLRDLSRRMSGRGTPAHLRAKVLEAPRDLDHQFRETELFLLSANFHSLVRMPAQSRFAAEQPEGYIARFDFLRVDMSVLAAYVELKQQNVLVLHAAVERSSARARVLKLGSDVTLFDLFYAAAMDFAAGEA